MSKHPNPVRGHVRCPVCATPSTVHRVGEGKLIAEGEPTKNGRNLGLHYYRCPNCGNSAMSKTIDSYIVANMVSDESQLTALLTAVSTEVTDALTPLENNAQPEATVELLLADEGDDSSNDATANAIATVESSVNAPVEPLPLFTVKRVLTVLGVLVFVVWMLGKLVPKKQPEAQPNANV